MHVLHYFRFAGVFRSECLTVMKRIRPDGSIVIIGPINRFNGYLHHRPSCCAYCLRDIGIHVENEVHNDPINFGFFPCSR